jgi:hypothetical protein
MLTNDRRRLGMAYDTGGEHDYGAARARKSSWAEASGRPGLFLRIPLDGDARDAMDFSIGFRVQF